jgi:hypothetical protein
MPRDYIKSFVFSYSVFVFGFLGLAYCVLQS